MRELAVTTALVGTLVAALLLAGQVAQLGRWVNGAEWLPMLSLGLVGLGEVLLPLSALLGAALTFGRWQGERHLTALFALGVSPARVLAPVAGLGLLLACAAYGLATELGPRALAALAVRVEAAAARAPYAGEGLALPGGGRLRGAGVSGELWGVVPTSGGPAVLRAAKLDVQSGGRVTLTDAHVWHPATRAHVGHLALTDLGTVRLPGAFRPPATLPSARLAADEPSHTLALNRRRCLAATTPLLALFGALLGGSLGRTMATLLAAGVVGLTYWSLRAGVLGVQREVLDPAIAGWLPLVMLLPVCGVSAWALRSRFCA